MLKRLGKITMWTALALCVCAAGLAATGYVLYLTADMGCPDEAVSLEDYPLREESGVRRCGESSLRRGDHGLWEAVLKGDGLERGVRMGVMAADLLEYQEKVFVDQIHRFVPSDRYLGFLRVLTIIFNRNMAAHVPQEYRREIYGISLSCSHRWDAIGTPYERQLNYHAAHDIGHTMQEYMFVGCSSFGVWDASSADSALLVGRNFDFYAGDDFARNKLVSFVFPDRGYKFASVGWPGMIGVLSGMNQTGLTVTLNAAKGPLPASGAMPISILARSILQYASTINEARRIADTCRTFVSESLLVGSAREGRAAIIEKRPDRQELYVPTDDRVICTNHYQSAAFADDEYNRESLTASDSPYRYARIAELIDSLRPLAPADAAFVLRDRRGAGGLDIGVGNEKSVNQSVGHHSVIFQPERLRMWVSTEPWQSGPYVGYDLERIFSGPIADGSLNDDSLTIPADSAFLRDDCPRVVKFRSDAALMKEALAGRETLPDGFIDRMIANNPEHYRVYDLAARYCAATGDREKAHEYWLTALSKEIPLLSQRREIENMLRE